MINNEIKILCRCIIKVYNKEVHIEGKFNPILFRHKYSSSLNKTIRLENNNFILPLNGFIVEYVCPTCNIINFIILKKFLLKTTLRCHKCRESDQNKKNKQSLYVKMSLNEHGKIIPKENKKDNIISLMNNDEIIKFSNQSFENESELFKINYYLKTPTEYEFNSIKNKIKVEKITIDKYYPCIRTTHSHKYSPKILDNMGNLHLLNKIIYKCECCENEFEGRHLKKRINQYKILCRNCTLCNKSFKIRYTNNIKGNKVRYQSLLELDLINFCNLYLIEIVNGPYVDYYFNQKNHKYLINFRIENILIEIKDNHKWHRDEVNSGKWQSKENSAIEYCKIHSLIYKLVMRYDLNLLKEELIRNKNINI